MRDEKIINIDILPENGKDRIEYESKIYQASLGSPISQISVWSLKILKQEIEKLPEDERELIYLHFYEGMGYRRMARILRMSKNGVKKKIKRILEKLRSRMESAL